MKIIVTTDGSVRPSNPGPMEIGGFCRTECGVPLGYFNKRLRKGTNNQAEYWAAFYGIKTAMSLKATSIVLEVDSQLVSLQLQGVYQVKNAALRKIKAAIVREHGEVPLEVRWEKRNVGARPIADALSRGNLGQAEDLIAELFPYEASGGLRNWNDLPEMDELDLETLETDFHTFDLTGEWE